MIDIHGGLLALTEIASAYREVKRQDGMESRLRDVSVFSDEHHLLDLIFLRFSNISLVYP